MPNCAWCRIFKVTAWFHSSTEGDNSTFLKECNTKYIFCVQAAMRMKHHLQAYLKRQGVLLRRTGAALTKKRCVHVTGSWWVWDGFKIIIFYLLHT